MEPTASIASQLAELRIGIAALAANTAAHQDEQVAISGRLDAIAADLSALRIGIDVLARDGWPPPARRAP